MQIIRTYKLRLKPTREQESQLRQTCAAVRAVYNAANEQRRLYGRPQGQDAHGRDSHFSKFNQSKDLSLPKLKRDPDLAWLSIAQADSFIYALEDLDQAWRKFFDNRRQGISCYPPRFRSAVQDNSFKMRAVSNAKGKQSKKGHFDGRRPNIVFNNRGVRLPKLGWISWLKHCRIRGDLRTAIVTCEGGLASGRWHICITSKIDIADPVPAGGAIGIDLGAAIPIALSNGEVAKIPPPSNKTTKRIKRAQRAVSRSKRWSRRRKARAARLAALNRKETVRVHRRLHKVSRMLVNRFGTIAIEDLKVSNMMRSAMGTVEDPGRNVHSNAALNHEMVSIPKYAFRVYLEYKAAAAGGEVIAVNAAHTSQTCAECGAVDKRSRQSQAQFVCVACGHRDNVNTNAARNILAKSGAVAGPRKTPSESRRGSATSSIGHEAPSCAAFSDGLSPVEADDGSTTPDTSMAMSCG
ncbi:transposase [uncultured Tateyamaria sp.]|uniref:RNA-guided endonuclease InsQ/TnpB family protein n=1 Tax=uncultured Tateyamaria sp. TaxID=455651 RepID=UPI00261B0A07|nr:transposase [uncultured Tateyamaria sp.]